MQPCIRRDYYKGRPIQLMDKPHLTGRIIDGKVNNELL